MQKVTQSTDSQRLFELIKREKLNGSKFCDIVDYNSRNLSNYLNDKVGYPGGNLIMKVLEFFPHWNIRWWLLGEGEPILSKGQLVVQKEYINDDERVRQLISIVDRITKENERISKENESLKKRMK